LKIFDEAQSKDFWVNASSKFNSIREASRELNLDRDTVKRYMDKFKLTFLSQTKTQIPLNEIKDAIITYGGISSAAKMLNIKSSNIRNRLYNEGTSMSKIMYEYQQKIAPEQKLTEIILGDCVITADYHTPFCSVLWVDRVVGIGKKENITQLLIAGDFFDFDRLSFWAKESNAVDITVPLDEELDLASMVLDKLESQYDKIYFVGGNHWLRLLKNITFSLSSRKALGLVDRANDPRYKINEYFNWILIDNKIRVTHPKRARKIDYTLARDLSIVHPDQWIVVAHRHRVNDGFTPSGLPMLEIGWLGDTERMRYVQHTDSTYYSWINGFAYYKKGKLHNLTEYNYDWIEIDKEECNA